MPQPTRNGTHSLLDHAFEIAVTFDVNSNLFNPTIVIRFFLLITSSWLIDLFLVSEGALIHIGDLPVKAYNQRGQD